jgi:hypothetical protein
LNPASYCLQALLASEMGNLDLACISPQYVPFGPSYTDSAFRSCTVAGSLPGGDSINGESYVELQYDASSGTIWRNFGIIVAFWIFWAFTAALGFEYNLSMGTGAKVLFDRSSRMMQLAIESDPEKSIGSSSSSMSDGKENVSAGETIFTFENIDYFVHHEGKEKQLLQHVSGYVKPGQLVALMGSSGAGKTTLMDVLAQRKDNGRIEGSIMVSLPGCGGISDFGVSNSTHASERATFTVIFGSIACSVPKLIERRSTDGRKAYPSSAPLATASRTMYMSLLQQFWNLCCSLHDCVRVTTLQMQRKCSMCTASWTS